MCGDLIRSDCRRLVIVRNKRNERKRQHCGNYEAKLHKTCLLNLQPGLTDLESGRTGIQRTGFRVKSETTSVRKVKVSSTGFDSLCWDYVFGKVEE